MLKNRFLLACLLLSSFSISATASAAKQNDPHYTPRGFFDIHVCNWPDRPLFLMGIFSTHEYDAVESVEIFTPDKRSAGTLDLSQFRQFRTKDKRIKRAFITQLPIPKNAVDGWYSATVKFKDGQLIHARDYVMHKTMPNPINPYPADNAEEIPLPTEFHWNPVKGARFYQVFIKDMWQDGKMIHESKVLDKPVLKLPKGLIKPGGYYRWHINARDINEDVKLGDFNHGSISTILNFTVAE